VESFRGISILTTNHEKGIDEAFRRRLSLHVRFPVPDAGERERIWRAMVPSAADVASDVAYRALAARFAMTGGYIKNAVLRAAFLAAVERQAIAMRHLEYAAHVEYEGMGKIAVRSAAA
jgi:SpoVK/Ycf46/Vps4 family AAA+-type ATPase